MRQNVNDATTTLQMTVIQVRIDSPKQQNNMDSNNLYTLNPSQIVMYSTSYCADCLRAKRFFELNNIPLVYVGLEENQEATEFVIQVNNGYRSVPTIVFPDGTILVEPNWEELKAKFPDL